MDKLTALIWLTFIVCAFFVWFFTHRANHQERLLRIEKGLEDQTDKKEKKRSHFFWLRLACLITGLSVGLLVNSLLVALNLLNKGGNLFPLAILGFCGGISMILAHYLQKDKSDPNDGR